MPNEPHKFLQIYFMGGEDSRSALANRVDARCGYNNLDSFFVRRIVSEQDALLNEYKELLKIFKSHMHKLESDNHAIVINPDKTPAGEHIRRFNTPVADDIAGIMVGDRTGAREIMIRRRNNNLQFIADTHRSYDALQYPLIFWKGQDGYSINIKQRDPVSAKFSPLYLDLSFIVTVQSPNKHCWSRRVLIHLNHLRWKIIAHNICCLNNTIQDATVLFLSLFASCIIGIYCCIVTWPFIGRRNLSQLGLPTILNYSASLNTLFLGRSAVQRSEFCLRLAKSAYLNFLNDLNKCLQDSLSSLAQPVLWLGQSRINVVRVRILSRVEERRGRYGSTRSSNLAIVVSFP
ncbi:helitron_like_N domain-containing protein [Nephila pilipes]|uniref:Helitron_like_N domain-containing protein n=1 Tax=Nephila pilipes TaxID=299642 RepID=A0A8X6UT11_NEPPI|nr:helitron_like_N domain-containing protein [Nephila pilipes]